MKPLQKSEIQKFWDVFSKSYDYEIGHSTMPVALSLYNVVRASKVKWILETGAGSGLSGLIFSQS